MASLGDTYNILIRSTNDNSGINSAKAETEGLGGSLKGLVGAFAIGNIAANVMMAATEKVGEAFNDVKQTAQEWQRQQAQLNAALKSTNDVSGVTKEDALGYAEQLSKTTPITREAALAGENMLLTFTGIHKDVFPKTTQAVADMATRMSGGAVPTLQQMNDTAIMVGKALNDPATGMTKLQRVGVTFTEQQKEQIKTMEAAGNTTGAQTVILNELAKEFGGSAAANATTFSGKMTMLKNNMVDLGVNGIQRLNVFLNEAVQWWEENRKSIENLTSKVSNFLKPSFDAFVRTIEGLMPTLKTLWNDVLKPLAIVLGVTIVASLWLLINTLNIAAQAFRDLVQWGKDVGDALVGAFRGTWNLMRNDARQLVNDIVNFFATLPQRAIAAIGNIGSAIGNDIKGALHSIHIPGFASGVSNFSGGLAVVGENGPELAYLPQGTNVYPNGTTPVGMGGTKTNNFYGDIHLNSGDAVQEWFRKLNQDTINVGRGLTPNQGVN